MFKGNPSIIRTQLRIWDGPNGIQRYYYDNWTHYFRPDELNDYWSKYNVDPRDFKLGIRVYFDGDGTLHISNCHDPDMRMFLEEKMKGWYRWAVNRNNDNHKAPCILDLIQPYTEEFKPGMYRTTYNGMTFIFDMEYRDQLEFAVFPIFDYREGHYYSDTGFSRLDAIVNEILKKERGSEDYDITQLGED